MKTPKKKKGFLEGYRTYSPEKEGYGNAESWREAFNQRMGIDVAREVMGSRDPYEILGVSKNATWDEIKSAHRKMAMRYHPDRNLGDEEALRNFKIIQAAYEVLEERR